MKLNYVIARTNLISITQIYLGYDTFLTGNVFKCLFFTKYDKLFLWNKIRKQNLLQLEGSY